MMLAHYERHQKRTEGGSTYNFLTLVNIDGK